MTVLSSLFIGGRVVSRGAGAVDSATEGGGLVGGTTGPSSQTADENDMTDAYIDCLTWKEDGRWVHSPGSNFWIDDDGWCVEVEFQALKHIGHPWRQKIIRSVGPGKAKKFGRHWQLTPQEKKDWDNVSRDVMLRLQREKYQRSRIARAWLLGTGKKLIVEGNVWHDNFWGNCHCGQARC